MYFLSVLASRVSVRSAAAAKTMGDILKEFLDLLTSGISSIATNIGTGVNTYVKQLFLEVSSTGEVSGLSTFGAVIAIFGGIALAVGLTTLIFNWIRSIGN